MSINESKILEMGKNIDEEMMRIARGYTNANPCGIEFAKTLIEIFKNQEEKLETLTRKVNALERAR